jgi:hypothetical protein
MLSLKISLAFCGVIKAVGGKGGLNIVIEMREVG